MIILHLINKIRSQAKMELHQNSKSEKEKKISQKRICKKVYTVEEEKTILKNISPPKNNDFVGQYNLVIELEKD